MSLAEKSDGILETHVQWEEVEEQMQKAFATSATFGPNRTVKNIGEGNGFMSRISLIHPDWKNGSDNLPEAFVAKICTALTMADFSAKSRENFDSSTVIEKLSKTCSIVHNNEVDTYTVLNKYSRGRIPLPKIYAFRKFSEENQTKGYMLMEYFKDLAPCHIIDNISIDSMKKVLHSVAIWQSIGLKMTEEERSSYSTTFLSDNFGDVFTPAIIEQLKIGLEKFCGVENSKLIQEFHDVMLKMCNKKCYAKLDNLPDRLGYKSVFSHGDLWNTNILWFKSGDELEIKAHIDFQTASFNSPALDLVRVFTTCLSGTDRRTHFTELLKTFYDYLSQEVEGDLPYTFEQLEQSYHYFVPHGAFVVVPMIDSIYHFIVKERPDLNLANKRSLVQKCIHLMEDAIESYRKLPWLQE